MSSTTGFRPAASARPWRSCTRSLRDAAISTSTSPTEVGLGPMTQKSRLTSSSENGMYWLASDSTCSSSSSSRRPAGSMIFLVMTADCGMAMRHVLGARAALADHPAHGVGDLVEFLDLAVGDPALLEAARTRSARAQTRRRRSVPSSTSLTLDELMSSPIIGACLRPNSGPENSRRSLPTSSPGGSALVDC